jgi:hypothetical protein
VKLMTAGELKAALQDVPDDATVQLYVSYNGGACTRMEVAQVAMQRTLGGMTWFQLYGCGYCERNPDRMKSNA